MALAPAFGLLLFTSNSTAQLSESTRLSDPPLPGARYEVQVEIPQIPMQASPQTAINASPLPLDQLEQLTLTSHPAVEEAFARVQAARGEWVQVGLKPNPTAGYIATEVGNEGRAGQQGAFWNQNFVRGNKLQLNRAVVSHKIARQQHLLLRTQLEVLTDVRVAFYELLVLQEQERVLTKLVELTEQAEQTAKQLFEAAESPKTDYLQARIELDRARLNLRSTRLEQQRALRVLASLAGVERLPAAIVDGSLDVTINPLDWDQVAQETVANNPQVLMALAEVEQARCEVARARVEPIPDLQTQLAAQYDYATEDMVTSVQAGFTLPVWDRNQGAIAQAYAELRAAEEQVARIHRELRQQLADVFVEYQTAQQTVRTFETDILPQAAETQQLISQAYRQGEVAFLDYLTAQRTYFQANLGYLDGLKAYWVGVSRIQGFLPSSIQ
jgi:cobalt-zinc-cadmium efflux system outer membrane protein